MDKTLKFPLKDFSHKGVGDKETYSFDVPAHFEDIKVLSNLEGQVEVMRIEDGFNVRIIELDLDVELTCVRSLKPFKQHIHISEGERQFYIDLPRQWKDINDLLLIDKKRFEIDPTEMFRQEIILHFPAVPVHYEGSTELIDRYKGDKTPENKPLAALKDLLK